MTRQIKFISYSILILLLIFGTFSVGHIQLAEAVQDGTGGNTINHIGGKTIHIFTSGGTFNPGPNVSSVTYLIVAGGGGGGGGGGSLGGGGGGGGVLTGTMAVTPNQAYSVVVGGGGGGGASPGSGNNGSNSSFNGQISIGGGGGGGDELNGSNGGSGGGGNYDPSLPGGNGTAGQGNAGGQGYGGFPQFGGGGGGAGSTPGNAPNGGNGIASSISGSSVTYAGGGGGGSVSTADPAGSGGGGAGANRGSGDTSSAGTPNTGGGGGGADFGNASNGGSGIVIISYPTPVAAPSCTGATISANWTTAVSGTLAVSANGVANAGSVMAYVFADPFSGSSIAYSATQSGTTWTANISLANPTNIGQIDAALYTYDAVGGEQTFCSQVSFNRLNTGTINVTSNVSSTWTITCPLTSPSCPTLSPSGSKTSDSYTVQPYSTWTITPATIPGYTATVQQGNTQTLQ